MCSAVPSALSAAFTEEASATSRLEVVCDNMSRSAARISKRTKCLHSYIVLDSGLARPFRIDILFNSALGLWEMVCFK